MTLIELNSRIHLRLQFGSRQMACMNAATTKALIMPGDRLGLTLCFAIVVHAIVILGVSFTPIEKTKPRLKSLEIILVQSRSEKKPEQASYLAQANLEGGGDSNEPVNPATLLAAPFLENGPQIGASSSISESPAPPPGAIEQSQDLAEALPRDQLAKDITETIRPQQLQASVTEAPASKPSRPESKRVSKLGPISKAVKSAAVSDPPLPSAATLISNSFALASLSAEIAQRLEARAKRPRRKFISANTREYKFAAYMEAWRAKVERVGNLNYPEEARRNKLSGSLILDVALKPDGSVSEITIHHPSGFKVLDDAAIRIVKLAAPFAPFPENIKTEVDILHITRTWRFLSTYRFSSK